MTACTSPGCDRPVAQKGLCWAHYNRARRGSDMTKPVKARRTSDAKVGEPCRKDGCSNPSISLGLCWAHYQRERRYGFDPDLMLAQQGGRCAVCGTDKPGCRQGWATDHDHVTGRVRGVLCHGCNIGLGAFADSITRLQQAIRYLKRTGHGQLAIAKGATR